MTKKQIDQLNEQAFNSAFKDLELAKSLTVRALQTSREEGYAVGEAWARLNKGLVMMESGHYEGAFEELEDAGRRFETIDVDNRGHAAVLNALGLLHIRLGKMHQAFLYLQDSLDICGRCGIKDIEYTTLNYMGIHQYRSEKYNQALRFFQKSLGLSDKSQTTSVLNNLGCTYRALKQNEKALDCLKKALIQSEREGKRDARISIHEELGLTYSQLQDFDKAVSHLETALELCIGLKRRHSPDLLIHLAEQYKEQKQLDKAERILIRAEKLLNDSNRISHRKLYLLQSGIEENKGNNKKALVLLKRYMKLGESLKSLDLDEEVWQLETAQYRAMNRRIASVAETGRKLTAILDRDQIIRTLQDSLASLFFIDSCAVGILDDDILNLKYYNLTREEYGTKHVSIERQGDLSSWVMLHNRDLIINNLDREIGDYLPNYDRSNVSFEIQSALCIPFASENHRGILGIYSRNHNSFNSEDRDFLAMLSSYAAIAIENAAQTEIIRSKNRALIQLNKYDPLTEIYNRRHLLYLLEQNWKLCRRNGSCLHLMILDADHFKHINDNYGHDVGDVCLKKLAQVLAETLKRSSDCYGRYGGEEFLVSVQDMSVEEAKQQAERIRSEIERIRISAMNTEIRMTVSIGMCSLVPSRDGGGPTLENLVKLADQNMYQSKSAGRNRVTASTMD